ncbi:MAG: ribonuclease HII, partial [Winogradskyella sp.]|nr:ribonuclease HII [Winogradskyella sp.]NNK21922.1 ribonuclease HII [Winogradskyella sp.]
NNTLEENFRDISIFKIKDNSIFKNSIAPFITFENASFGFIFDNYSVYSDNIKTLKAIISFKLNNKTLATSEKFQFIKQHLAANSSILIYKDGEGLYNFLNRSVKGYNANAVQYVYDSDFAHINGVLQKYKKRGSSNSITEDFSTSVTADIILPPQLVKNHRNNSYEIVTQDTNNRLYLVSSSGSILWKKQLSGPVLGKIEQIDIYKNGRLQLVFATPNNVYVIDRNGKDVGPFPKKFNDKITQPLSVFDYDNKKNYRLLVTQNKSLLMLDVSTKRVTGFTYNKAQNTINSQPKHFRIGSKDYIVFSHGQKLEILNRQGKERVNAKKGIDFSENEIFIYQNKFTTLDKNGQLIQFDTKGRISIANLDLDVNSKITTTSKTLVALDENKLKIKSKTIDLDYGSYTSPEIFYLNDKIYVSITDLQSKKVYIFDSLGKLLPNFPVFGTASAKLQNLDRKRGLELVTQADEKTILVYKIN